MSSALYWKPVTHPDGILSDELKFVLRRKFGNPITVQMDKENLPYLHGLRDAGVKGVNELISAIEKHGDVIVKEVWSWIACVT